MRIYICDDDPTITKELNHYLNDYFKQKKLTTPEIRTFHNGEDLLADKDSKDIVFLDIEMEGRDGIQIGQALMKQNPHAIILIVTSFIEYLDDAMRFHVFRYLSKPIDRQRLYNNLSEAILFYNTSSIKISITDSQGGHTVHVSDIVFVEIQTRTVIVHMENEDYFSDKGYDYWKDILSDSNFFQSHRSYFVNMHYISSFDHSTISLCDGKYTAYLTRRKYTEFKDTYFLYLESMR